jgi:PD-(D/E)XK endonuclease
MTSIIPEIHAVCLTTRKALGEAAEAAFLAKATSLGFGVAKTWGDSERYDFILDSGQKRWRVQVKSCRYFRSCYHVATRGVTRAYTADEVDFIVVYLVPENLWYVIPISLAALRNRMYLSPNRPLHSENEKYREAWCQMACPRDESAPTRLLLKRQPDYPFDECKLCNLKCPLKEIRIPLTRDRRGRWRKSPCLSAAEKESVQASGQRFRSSSVP